MKANTVHLLVRKMTVTSAWISNFYFDYKSGNGKALDYFFLKQNGCMLDDRFTQ